jgi:iron complex transport system ATP-binding protein
MKLEAKGIVVTAGQKRIVDGADLTIGEGQFLGLIGPNGAGKSTLLRAIVGVQPREAGEVSLDGRPAEEYPPRERAKRVAFLPQERRVEWRVPARDVVMLGRYPHHAGFGGPTAADRDAVERSIESVDAHGLEDRPAAVLSAGEKARILLARALAVEAPILIADEPIAALDPYHQLHVMEILRGQARAGRAVLVVLHDLMLASRFMDRLALMSDGKIIADGKPEDVLSDERLRTVYRIDAIRGVQAGAAWLSPWARTGDHDRK